MWAEKVTLCECDQPGWCERHHTQKISVWYVLCRTNQAAFDQWEAGQGPRIEHGGVVAPVVTQRTDCRFRGDEPLEQVPCECCGGRIEARTVYACQLHQRCLEQFCRSHMQAIQHCQTCADFAARDTGPPIPDSMM